MAGTVRLPLAHSHRRPAAVASLGILCLPDPQHFAACPLDHVRVAAKPQLGVREQFLITIP